MFFRARRALNRAWFDQHLKGVLQTPSVPQATSDNIVASMLCHGDLIMYLLAVKSLIWRLDEKPRVVVLNDGSLTPEDTEVLHRHLPTLTIIPIASIDRGRCPKGGAWELLLMMTDLVKEGYVVQVDSDTLTLGPIDQVNECVGAGHSFALLGDRSYPHAEPMLEACARLKTNLHPHVQAHVERSFDELPEAGDLKYLRGNAGFIGLGKNTIDRERVQWFSDLMRRISGEKWNEWGSEQVTTNLLIANTDGSVPLSAAKYLSYWAHADIDYANASFLHFIGPHRYSSGFYRKSAEKVLRALRSAADAS